ncbi:hypothetical protein [Flammeovirga sp. SJP92]|uniref:hypothetical protein n=1 Tax=Flammeovirga sp. SJP92 TaxID=1775430 RepID=UPI000788FE09|nr:hypothetical protein [Flammeovirga sp. SJP92]KXX70839.1 hypothetical protein AVL50_11380 [Flammeovirga sp. SJP92]
MKNILLIVFIVSYSLLLMAQEQTKAGFQIIKETIELNTLENNLDLENNRSFIELLFETGDTVD